MVTLHNIVLLSLIIFRMSLSYLMMWIFVYVKTDFHPTSHILPMDIN